MTIGQEDILRYARTEYPGMRTEAIGDGVVSITEPNGNEIHLTMNIFGDILECLPNGKKRVIAESDLPHNLEKIPLNARVKSWKKICDRVPE